MGGASNTYLNNFITWGERDFSYAEGNQHTSILDMAYFDLSSMGRGYGATNTGGEYSSGDGDGGNGGDSGDGGTPTTCTVGQAKQILSKLGKSPKAIEKALEKLGNPDDNTTINIKETLDLLGKEESNGNSESEGNGGDGSAIVFTETEGVGHAFISIVGDLSIPMEGIMVQRLQV